MGIGDVFSVCRAKGVIEQKNFADVAPFDDILVDVCSVFFVPFQRKAYEFACYYYGERFFFYSSYY
jgi:hypothetical protein